MQAQRGVEVNFYVFFSIGARLGWLVNDKAALPPANSSGSNYTKGWVGLVADLDECGISHRHWGSNPEPYSP